MILVEVYISGNSCLPYEAADVSDLPINFYIMKITDQSPVSKNKTMKILLILM